MEIDLSYRQKISLADGRTVLIRAVQPEDKQLFVDAIERSSLATIYDLFLSAQSGFTDAELACFTEVDGIDHFALGAVHQGSGVGGGPILHSPQSHSEAEMSFAVDDRFRSVGPAPTPLRPLSMPGNEGSSG